MTHNSSFKTVVSVMPAADTVYPIPLAELDSGIYQVTFMIQSSVTGATSGAALVPYMDAERTTVADPTYGHFEGDDTGGGQLIQVSAGAAVTYGYVAPCHAAGANAQIQVPAHGVGVKVTKGGATTGEQFVVQVSWTKLA